MPASSPRIEASTPMMSASAMTAPRTWRRDAPRVLSIPNSRRRCAIVIENVLKMMKLPTNTATPANASSAMFRNLRLSRMSDDCLAACSCPVRTSTERGSAARTRCFSCCALTP